MVAVHESSHHHSNWTSPSSHATATRPARLSQELDRSPGAGHRSYVAVALAGKGVAWAGKTYVAYADVRPFVALPDYAPGEWRRHRVTTRGARPARIAARGGRHPAAVSVTDESATWGRISCRALDAGCARGQTTSAPALRCGNGAATTRSMNAGCDSTCRREGARAGRGRLARGRPLFTRGCARTIVAARRYMNRR
jgi:hypothetical protein